MGPDWQTGYMESPKSPSPAVVSPDIVFPGPQTVGLSHTGLQYSPPAALCLDSLRGPFAHPLKVQPENHKSWS